MSTQAKIRAIVRNNRLYQIYRARKFFNMELAHVKKDSSFQKRICFSKGEKDRQIVNMMNMVRIQFDPNARFQCWIDEGLYTFKSETMTDNIPPNYESVIYNSLNALVQKYQSYSNEVASSNVTVIKGVISYIRKIVSVLKAEIDSGNGNKEKLKRSVNIYSRMIDSPAENLEEAFQRILLWQSLFWQSHHRLLGLGRLDKILDPLLKKDNQSNEELKDLIREFYDALHKYYGFKSNKISKGDTGQIIVVGGCDPDESYFCNRLTYLFIGALIGHRLPDPKVLLRVSSKMPDDLLELAIQCISTGIGCPLLSNDDVVVPAIEDFGYSHEDAYNYVSSACWEPLVYGKSLEKNNLADINYGQAIVEMYQDVNFTKAQNFEDVFSIFEEKLNQEVERKLRVIDSVRWEEDPLMSLFTENCLEKGSDISKGGAVYNNYGLLSAGMENAVNSLINIEHLVFGNEKRLSLEEIKKAADSNYEDLKIRRILDEHKYYGRDCEEAVTLTKRITKISATKCSEYKNIFGGKVKFGLSTSNYLEEGKQTNATLDGRCSGEALAVHISNPKGASYTELVGFASQLEYLGNKSNGNVLDFFVSPAIIQNEKSKFKLFLKKSIGMGFFQMQINVVSSEDLIDAQKNPGKYPDLIVRVWGFSAYFDELPKDYQDVLIRRALASEGKSFEEVSV